MASVATWVLGMIGYYSVLALFIVCLSVGGMLDSDTSMNSTISTTYTNSSGMDIPDSASTWSIGSVFWDLLSFYGFGADLGLGGFGNFMVTFIFMWVPSWIFVILMLFAIRNGSG
jgi:hypothetical protein